MVNRIKDLRSACGLSQAELGNMLNCTDVTVSRYESGKRELTPPTICALCDIFGCTSDYLLGRASLPSSDLTPEEEALLLAFRASDQRAREMVLLALHPFWQEDDAGKAI